MLGAGATKLSCGFCQQYQELPRGHPSKQYPGPILLDFSVQMVTGNGKGLLTGDGRDWKSLNVAMAIRLFKPSQN